ncbi:MAG: HEAT repeat domain-containing protein [Planctomycetes bacterium]|nr:HEAT repeat domain-containing protein [Planctomycetota bacterium]
MCQISSRILGLLFLACAQNAPGIPSSGYELGNDTQVSKKIEALIRVFADPEAQSARIQQTARAIRELGEIGEPAVPKLLEAILGKHQVVAAYSANALDEIGEPAVDVVRRKWGQVNDAEKWKLMRFRGKFDYDASLEFALQSLDVKESALRRQAIQHMGRYTEPKARKKLLAMLNAEVPESHRWLIIESLAELGNNEEVADALIALLAPTSWAAKGKGLIHPPGNTPPWWPDGREHVIEALAKMGAKKAAPKLLEVLQEKEPNKGFYFNTEIVHLLGELSYAGCIPEFKRLLVLKHEWCWRENAARALYCAPKTGPPRRVS